MADFEATTTVDASEDALFDYLSQVHNLPEYFSRIVSAEPGEGEQVHTTARMPDGQQVQGDAWFRVDRGGKSIRWGSQGPNDYHGELSVSSSGDGASVQVTLHTTRVPAGDGQVRDGLDGTLANIKRLVEEQGAA